MLYILILKKKKKKPLIISLIEESFKVNSRFSVCLAIGFLSYAYFTFQFIFGTIYGSYCIF